MNKLDDAIQMLKVRGFDELLVLKVMLELYDHHFMIIDWPEGFDLSQPTSTGIPQLCPTEDIAATAE